MNTYKAQHGNLIKIVKGDGDSNKIIGWHYQPAVGDICVALDLEDSTYIRAVPNDMADYNNGDYCLLDEAQYEVIKTSEQQPLKRFKVGEWYTNPMYTAYDQDGNRVKISACRVKSVSLEYNKWRDEYFHSFTFDQLVDIDGNELERRFGTQSNSEFEYHMEHLSNYTLDNKKLKQPVMKETFPKTPTSIHAQILASLNLKPGDLVKVTHAVPSHHLGWENSWQNNMNQFVGKEFAVKNILSDDTGVHLEAACGYFPAQSLQVISRAVKFKTIKISDEYSAKVYAKDKILVGCQTVTKKTFDQIAKEFYPNLKMYADLSKI